MRTTASQPHVAIVGQMPGSQHFRTIDRHEVITAPEVLMAAIAATTERIRVGSAGVMLPHYSALKVADAVEFPAQAAISAMAAALA